MSHIENPTAYWNAVDARIKARASMKRRREFEERHPEALAILADLWWPEQKPCCDQREFNEWSECVACGNVGGTMGWKKDGSHLVLHTMTVRERNALLKQTEWLRGGWDKYDSLTDGQVTKLHEIVERVRGRVSEWDRQEEQRQENALPWTAGRQDVEVTLVSAKLKRQPSFNPYDRYDDLVWKGVFQREDGSRVWCTIPSKLIDLAGWLDEDAMAKALRGATCTLTVTVEPKDGEPTFAFGKRPTVLKKNEGSMALPNLPEEEA